MVLRLCCGFLLLKKKIFVHVETDKGEKDGRGSMSVSVFIPDSFPLQGAVGV